MKKINEKLEKVDVVKMIKIELTRGIGTKDDRIRTVIQYWDLDGNLIYDNDNYLDETNSLASSNDKS